MPPSVSLSIRATNCSEDKAPAAGLWRENTMGASILDHHSVLCEVSHREPVDHLKVGQNGVSQVQPS